MTWSINSASSASMCGTRSRIVCCGAIAERLEHVALGAGGHRLLEEVDAFLRRDHDHGAMRSAAGDQPGRLNAIQVGHVDVHQDDVRLELGGASNRLVTARGGADQV